MNITIEQASTITSQLQHVTSDFVSEASSQNNGMREYLLAWKSRTLEPLMWRVTTREELFTNWNEVVNCVENGMNWSNVLEESQREELLKELEEIKKNIASLLQ